MTDVVQKRLELMTPEVEEMRRTKLYTEEEIKNLLVKRKEFEHKIHSRIKELQYFTDYIHYEKCLLKDIKLRRNKFKCGEKKSNIEYTIIKRVKSLYEIAVQRFPEEMGLFHSFLKFCEKVNFVNAASDLISNMIKKHSINPQVWQIAAKWHRQQRKDAKTAMGLLLKAVAIHKDSSILYKEIILTKMYEFKQCTSLDENTEQQELYNKQLQKIVSASFQNVKDCEFYLFVLETIEKYEFTKKIQEDIKEHLKMNHSDTEIMWDYLAKNQMKDILKYNNNNNNEEIQESLINHLEACLDKYKEGFAAISTSHKANLWNFYIDYLLILQGKFTGNDAVQEILKTALNEAYQVENLCINLLSEKHLLTWMKSADQNDALNIATRGTETIPHSVHLWTARLSLLIMNNRPVKEIEEVFHLGVTALKENALVLWKIMMEYQCRASSDPLLIEQMYMKGIKTPYEEISNELKEEYLDWTFKTKGINDARHIYKELASIRPYSRDLHHKMLCLESRLDVKACQQIYELACEQFGNTDIDIWISYIRYYLNSCKKQHNMNDIVEDIRKRAMKILPQNLHDFFTKKYNAVLQLV